MPWEKPGHTTEAHSIMLQKFTKRCCGIVTRQNSSVSQVLWCRQVWAGLFLILPGTAILTSLSQQVQILRTILSKQLAAGTSTVQPFQATSNSGTMKSTVYTMSTFLTKPS